MKFVQLEVSIAHSLHQKHVNAQRNDTLLLDWCAFHGIALCKCGQRRDRRFENLGGDDQSHVSIQQSNALDRVVQLWQRTGCSQYDKVLRL
jgi:hypothetical protein